MAPQTTLSRSFTAGRPSLKGLSPETEDPQPKEAEPHTVLEASAPANITIEEYHKFSDAYMEALVDKFEALQEEKTEIDCEYSVCSFLPI